MPDPQPFLSLGLNAKPAPAPPLPAAETLQFKRAEAPDAQGTVPLPRCLRCSKPIGLTYFHAFGKVVCPECAHAFESSQQEPGAHAPLKAALYGLGAAAAGCALYATVAIVTGLQLALIAILIGYMVGKAVRHGSGGLGGRRQQILAVLLTYFAISVSYIPVGIYAMQKARPKTVVTIDGTRKTPAIKSQVIARVLAYLAALAVAAPFLQLKSLSGLISLFIIFIGLQRAWRMTGRVDIPITGPYQVTL